MRTLFSWKTGLGLWMGFAALAGDSSGAGFKTGDARTFVRIVRVMDQIETRAEKPRTSMLDWILPLANAKATSCIIAGHIGQVRNGSCVHPGEAIRKNGRITCNPELFGELSIPTPRDSRWTRACGNAFLKKAGVEKTIEDELSEEESGKVSKLLNDLKLPANGIEDKMAKLCEVAKKSRRAKDIEDCSLIESLVQSSIATDPVTCEKTPVTPTGVKDLNLSMRKAMFGFDPKKHRVCRDAESKDESKYGHFTFGLAGDLEKIGGADPQGRVCYQKAFLDEATRHISAALNGTEFNPSGTNTTIPVGHCDFNVNYVGTDRSKYKRDAEREIFITSSFKSHHETTPHTINTLLFPVEFTETQWVQGQKTTQDLFDYTFKGRQTSTDELFRDYVTKNPNGKRHADLVLTLAKAAYIYCSDN